MSANWIGILALALVLVTGALWFRLIQQVAVPRNRSAYLGAMLSGAGLGILAFVLGAGWIGGIPAGVAITIGLVFAGLRLQSAQDAREPAVRIGGPILDFVAPDENGNDFDLASLRGRPYLLKFFRGHW